MDYTTIKIKVKNKNGLVTSSMITAGPPFGSTLGPYGFNIGAVVGEIKQILDNQTEYYSRIYVAILKTDANSYKIDIYPTLVGRILKAANRFVGTVDQSEPEFYLTTSQIKQIAIDHRPYMNNNILSKLVSMVRGTLKTCGGAEIDDGTIIDDEIIGDPIVKRERKYKAVLTSISYSLNDDLLRQQNFTMLFNKYFLNMEYKLLDYEHTQFYNSLDIETKISAAQILITDSSFIEQYLPLQLKLDGKSVLMHEDILEIQKDWNKIGANVLCYYNEHPSLKSHRQLYDVVIDGVKTRNIYEFRKALSSFIPDLSLRKTQQIIENIPTVILSRITYKTLTKVKKQLYKYVSISTYPKEIIYNTYIPENGDVVHTHTIYVKLLNISKNDEYSQLLLRNILEYFNYTNEYINNIINDLSNNLPLIVAEIPDNEKQNVISMLDEQTLAIDNSNYYCVINSNTDSEFSINFVIACDSEGISCYGLCSVVVESYNQSVKSQLIRCIRNITGMGLKEAKYFVESLPGIIGDSLTYNDAVALANEIQNNGGYCTVRDENNNVVYNPAEEYTNPDSSIPQGEDDDSEFELLFD